MSDGFIPQRIWQASEYKGTHGDMMIDGIIFHLVWVDSETCEMFPCPCLD